MQQPTTLVSQDLSRFRSIHRKKSEFLENPIATITVSEITDKVVEDIHFLRGRINHIQNAQHTHSSPSILKTYQSMLESKEAILTWLCKTYDLTIDKENFERSCVLSN